MAKNTVADYSKTASQNTDIAGVDIDEGCSPAGVNNAIREVMADIAAVYDGTQALASPDINGGTIDGATINNSAIGGTTPAAGSFTQINGTQANISGAVIANGAGTFGDDVDITGDVTVTGNVSAASFSGDGSGLSNLFISGMIMLWSGSIASIPTGWVLCNGQNNTPDLRNRFVTGAGDSYSVNAKGGQNSITGVPAHTHGFTANTGSAGAHGHSGSTGNAGSHNHTFSANTGGAGSHNHTGSTSTVGDHQHHGWGENRTDWPYGVSGSRNKRGSKDNDTDNYFFNTSPAGAHSHSFTTSSIGNHQHSVSGTTSNVSNHNHSVSISSVGNHQHSVSGTTNSTGSSSIDIRPLYYALAYIMKT